MALPLPPVQLRNNYAGWYLALWNYIVGLILSFIRQSPPVCKAVITDIAAFNAANGTIRATAVGYIGDQDEFIVISADDRVFLPPLTGGAGGAVGGPNSGPYVVVDPGSASTVFVLERPAEYLQGSLIPEEITFTIGGGANWGGNDWRAFPATAALLVGTGDPVFYPRTFQATHSVVNPATTVAVTDFWLRETNRLSMVNSDSVTPWYVTGQTVGQGTGAFVIHCVSDGTDLFHTLAINF